MKTLTYLLLAGSAVALFSSSAMAADLMAPMAPAPVVAAPSTNWDGPYIGATVGYGWGSASASSISMSASPTGFLAGVQAGYNFHLSDNIIAGVEGNIDWANEAVTVPSFGSFTVGWDGSIRGRLGYDGGEFMPYVEAGVAFANATAAAIGGTPSFSGTYTGWTVGAGVEFMLANQLSANVEYRYNNYGSQTFNTVPIAFTDSQFRVGLNYHF